MTEQRKIGRCLRLEDLPNAGETWLWHEDNMLVKIVAVTRCAPRVQDSEIVFTAGGGDQRCGVIEFLSSYRPAVIRRCKATGNPCGTDTWAEVGGVLQPCLCLQCQLYLKEESKKREGTGVTR